MRQHVRSCVGLVFLFAAVLLLGGCAKAAKTPMPIFGSTRAVPQPGVSSAGQRAVTRSAHDEFLTSSGADPTEEIWVIARRQEAVEADNRDYPGSGAMLTRWDGREVPLPLQHTDVRASISGYIGSLQVVQQFGNPYSSKIEAVYVFPLPHNAAVNEFLMTIGDRRIRGIIRERVEAEQIYQEAKTQGYVASLLTEERPNIFTQSVANIEPGRQIDVTIRYFHTLQYADGWYEFVFPMVVGPRFNPPGRADGIGAVGRGRTGISGQNTEVNYLRPGERSGHDISVHIDVNAGMALEEYECRSHRLVQEPAAEGHLALALDEQDSIPNRDLVLRYRVAGDRIKTGLLTHRDERGGYFTLMLQPPRDLAGLERQPLEIVFVLDCSGSMSGKPIQQAKAAIERALHLLEPTDSFQLINFSTHASQLGATPLKATPHNVQRGLDYLRKLNGDGGTMMIEGIKAALDFEHDPKRLRFVCFLTDGYIGNEAEILGEIHKRLGSSRIFSFGIGSAVNRYLIEHMAKLGRGAVAYLGPKDSAAEIMEQFFDRIGHPALTDIHIDWGELGVNEVYPRQIPDLFVGKPVILTGRFHGRDRATIRVTGTAGGEPIEYTLAAKATSSVAAPHRALPSVWARTKIADIADRATYAHRAGLAEEIKRVALDYGLMSPCTAFVAVDATRRTQGHEGTTVGVAVPVPDGVKYETTVEE